MSRLDDMLMNNINGGSSSKELRPWRYKFERVSRGYVRATVCGDDLEGLVQEWKVIHLRLEEIGEKVEKVNGDENNGI